MISEWSPKLADAVEGVLDAGELPVVLGGDCPIVLGPTLALKRRGRYGLLFIDRHADFYQPEVNPNGEAASMDLAFATGHGPALLTDLEGRGAVVRDEDAFIFGFRDADDDLHTRPPRLGRTPVGSRDPRHHAGVSWLFGDGELRSPR
jgi:arginase